MDFFVSVAEVDKADGFIFQRKFFETVILFLRKDMVILGSGLGGQNSLQYENH